MNRYIIISMILFVLLYMGVHIAKFFMPAHTIVPVWLSVIFALICINVLVAMAIALIRAFRDI